MNNLFDLIKQLEPQMVADRRHFHENPELSFQENKTMEYICTRLDALGISYQRGIAGTGVLAEVKGERDGKCLLIRADMDALPIMEKNDVAYASKKIGVMHACGHDVHTAILLCTCEFLHQLRDKICGSVKFAFQPGEETTGGAKPMIDAGILENPAVDACLALHVDPDLDAGSIWIKSGPLYASPDDFYITIKGKGGHGAEPQHAIDPILITAQIIRELQNMTSNDAVVTVTSVHAGDATNVIPDIAELAGTARSLDEKTRSMLEERIENIVKTACDARGARYEYRFERLFPPLQNDAIISALIADSAKRCLGKSNCIEGGLPTMKGEDFAYFAQAVPSALFKLGCRNEEKGITAPIHNSKFDVDEASMAFGVAIFADAALHFLQEE